MTSLRNTEREIEQGNESVERADNQVIQKILPKGSVTRTNSERRDETTERQRREANLGIILVCISLLFILCQSIKIVPDVSKSRWLY